MRSALPVLLLVVSTPLALIGFRLLGQEWALHGPSRGSGLVEGEVVRLSSRVGGRIAAVKVHEGQAVAHGDVLVEVDCGEPRAQLAEARARLEAARAEAASAAAQAGAANSSRSAAKASAQAARAQADAVAAQYQAADRQAHRLQSLPSGVPDATRDQASTGANALAHQQGAANAQAEASRFQASAAGGQADAAAARARAAEEAVIAAEAGVARVELLVDECTVRAPWDGVVDVLPYHPGEVAPPGATLVELVDLNQLTATFWIPNAELGAVVTGGSAEVYADAWPGQVFAGTVKTVSVQAEFTPRNIQTRQDRDRLVYPVEIDVPNPDGRLRPGMPVEMVLVGTER